MHGMINHNLSELSTTFMTQKERKRNNALLSAFLTLSLSLCSTQTNCYHNARSLCYQFHHTLCFKFFQFVLLSTIFHAHAHTAAFALCVVCLCALIYAALLLLRFSSFCCCYQQRAARANLPTAAAPQFGCTHTVTQKIKHCLRFAVRRRSVAVNAGVCVAAFSFVEGN